MQIKTKTRNSIIYLVPGPVVLNKERNATVRIKKGPRYYSIWLSYGTIDGAPDAERGAFDACLKEAEQELFNSSPESGSDPFTRLFLEFAPELPVHAKCYGSGLKWANFVGVTEGFTERFLVIVGQLYGKALALYTRQYGDWTGEQWMQFTLRRSTHKRLDACVYGDSSM